MQKTNTKSSPLIVIIAIAIILFIAAVVWKNNKPNNAEEITIYKEDAQIKAPKKRTSSEVYNAPTDNQPVDTEHDDGMMNLTEDDRKRLVDWSRRYRTVKSAEIGIEHYKRLGDTESVEKLYAILDELEKYKNEQKK